MTGLLKVEDKIDDISKFLSELDSKVDSFEALIEEKKFDECMDLDDSINSEIDKIKSQALMRTLEFKENEAERFTQVMRKSEKFHDHYRAEKAENNRKNVEIELTSKLKEVETELKEISKMKNSFVNIISVFTGLLGFIFINFNVFNDIGQLRISHILTVVSLLNFTFVGGLILMTVLFKSLMSDDEINLKPLIYIMAAYLILTIIIISIVHPQNILNFILMLKSIFTNKSS